MPTKFLNNNVNFIVLSGCFVIFLSYFFPFILAFLIITSGIFLILLFTEKAVLVILIINYLTITGELVGEYRTYLNVLAFFSLVYLFIKKFGFYISKYIKVPKEILIFISFLLLTLILSSVFSSYPSQGIIATARLTLFLVICYIFYSLLNNEKNIYVFIFAIFGVILLLGLPILIDLYNLGIQNYFIRVFIADSSDLFGSIGFTDLTVFFISISLVTALFFMDKINKPWKKIFLSIFFVFNIILLILANSRGGLIASIISIIFILAVLKRTLLFKILLTLPFLIVFLFFLFPSFEETVIVYARWEGGDPRQILWETGIDMIKDYPVLGVGTDLYGNYYHTYAPLSFVQYINEVAPIKSGKGHPHNFFIYYTAENGILGLLVSISFFILFFYFSIKTMRLTKYINYNYYVLSTAITGIGIGIFFRSFIEVSGYLYYGYITTDLPFWLMFGILISINQKFSNSNPQ